MERDITSYTGQIAPEREHYARLLAELRHELQTNGVDSLAAVVATVLEHDTYDALAQRAALAFRRIADGHF